MLATHKGSKVILELTALLCWLCPRAPAATTNVPEILAPSQEVTFDAGATVHLSARLRDPEGGTLPGSSFRWDVVIIHPQHQHEHAIVEGLSGAEQSFDLPIQGLNESWNVTIRLTATDSEGHSAIAERRVGLNGATLRLESDPPGLRLTVDGASIVTPGLYESVNGAVVELVAPSPQVTPGGVADGRMQTFKIWADDGARTHEVTARDGLLLSAVFEPDPKSIFLRGDANRDGKLDISDAVFTLGSLFLGGPLPPCRDAADANDDGTIDVSDALTTLNSLFGDSGPLPEPSGSPGFDPTDDAVACES